MDASLKHIFRPPHEEKRAKLSRHILEAIEPMLEETPYADLRVESIIKAGGISRATFYAYFDDKVDLLRAMVEDVVGELHSVAFWRIPDNADKETLREALRGVTATYRSHRLVMRALVEGAGYDERLRTVYQGVLAQGIANATAHIERGQRDGNIAPFLSPAGTARLLVFMGERALYQLVGVEGEQDEALLDPLTEVFWRTLYEGYR
jgi:AcrR family transcriptional regulator